MIAFFMHFLPMAILRAVIRIVSSFAILIPCLMLAGCGLLSPKPEKTYPTISCTGIVKTAYSQIGKKYRLGGDSPQKGFDCSGLVWWAYKQHGVTVPRITSDQAKTGKKVTKSAVKPGDIVVFRSGAGPRGLHTGLYAGKDFFIHSPRTGKRVCMEKLSSPHWKKTLIAIRRVGK